MNRVRRRPSLALGVMALMAALFWIVPPGMAAPTSGPDLEMALRTELQHQPVLLQVEVPLRGGQHADVRHRLDQHRLLPGPGRAPRERRVLLLVEALAFADVLHPESAFEERAAAQAFAPE